MSLSNGKASVDSSGNLYTIVGYEISKYNQTTKNNSLIYLTDAFLELYKGTGVNLEAAMRAIDGGPFSISTNPVTNITYISLQNIYFEMKYDLVKKKYSLKQLFTE